MTNRLDFMQIGIMLGLNLREILNGTSPEQIIFLEECQVGVWEDKDGILGIMLRMKPPGREGGVKPRILQDEIQLENLFES